MKKMMKTIKTGLLLLMAWFLALSCSNDDGTAASIQLILNATSVSVDEGEELIFEVTAGGKPVSDAQILIDGSAISGYKYSFETAGTYQAVAKKEGCRNSEPLDISVEVPPDIYVAGYEKNGSFTVATYWKNGVPVNLTNGTNYASAFSVFVSEDDVYVAGDEHTASNIVATYWNLPAGEAGNGTPVILPSGNNSAFARSIFVFEGDVYVGGYEKNGAIFVARYWKNGTPVILGSGVNSSFATSIFVSEGDVYVAGHENNGVHDVAKYWKNGVPVSLTDGNDAAHANSIFVFDGDVYVAGVEDGIAKYWKNGEAVNLTNGTNDAILYSVFVSNGDIYVAGSEESENISIAKYWKNDSPVNLTDGINSAYANSIFVSEDDIYVAGIEKNESVFVAKYWKNGMPMDLTNGTHDAMAYSIFVVE